MWTEELMAALCKLELIGEMHYCNITYASYGDSTCEIYELKILENLTQ